MRQQFLWLKVSHNQNLFVRYVCVSGRFDNDCFIIISITVAEYFKVSTEAMEPEVATNLSWNHLFHNKQLCSDDSCKHGISGKRRNKPAQLLTPRTPGVVGMVKNHLQHLKQRVTELSDTSPVTYKRPRLQVRPSFLLVVLYFLSRILFSLFEC